MAVVSCARRQVLTANATGGQTVPVNGVVPDSLANQSISWSMLPDWSVSQLVNDASQSSQWWAQQKGSRVLWEMPVTKKDFKSDNEQKRKEKR